MIKSPVFLQLVSNSCKLEFKSAASISILGFNASSGLIDQKSTALINSLLITSTSHREPVSLEKSIKFLSEKLLTTNPVLNLLSPSASLTSKDCVLTSKALKEVVNSKFSILFSRAPISLIVNLLLSYILILGALTVLKRYGGRDISAISIEFPTSVGGTGSSDDSPFINLTSSYWLITNLSILGR